MIRFILTTGLLLAALYPGMAPADEPSSADRGALKQIVQGHNGRIEVKSKMGVGTSFTFHIPRATRTVPRD